MADKPNQELETRVRVLYIRVSTEAQAEEGYSIGAQQERLEAYCRAMGWKNYQFYIDPGFSGSNLNRPQMQQLITDVQSGKVCAVVVYKLDRLSRSQKDTLYLIEDIFIPNDVAFVSLNENIDTGTPYGRAMIGILSAFAQLERENIYQRTRMGMLERVKQGYWMGGGGIPYGYDYDRNKGILVPNEQQAEQVRKMYDLYLKGYSAQKIANMLGLRYDRIVTQILSRKSNTGVICYKGEEYPGLHEPIISEEIYNLTQIKMRERSEKSRVPTKGTHLLAGLVYCGECGARMRYVKWGKNGYKLYCYSKDNSKPHMKRADSCDSEPCWADQIEDLVIQDLFNISANLARSTKEDGAPSVNPLQELESQIAQTEAKVKRLYNLYAIDGNDMLLDTIEENKRQLALLREQLIMEEETQTRAKHIDLVRERVVSIRSAWDMLSTQERQTVLRDCIDRIIIYKNKVEIFYTFLKEKGKAGTAKYVA